MMEERRILITVGELVDKLSKVDRDLEVVYSSGCLDPEMYTLGVLVTNRLIIEVGGNGWP